MSDTTDDARISRLETKIAILETRLALTVEAGNTVAKSCLGLVDVVEMLLRRVSTLETGNVYTEPLPSAFHDKAGSGQAPQNGSLPATC